DRGRLLALAQSQTQFPAQSIFTLDEFLDGRFDYLTSGSFGSAMVAQRGRRRTPFAVKLVTCWPLALCKGSMHRTGMRYRDIEREVRCMHQLMALARGVKLTAVSEEANQGESPKTDDAELVGDNDQKRQTNKSCTT